MKLLSLSVLLTSLALAPIAAKADTLTGSTVNGSLTFYGFSGLDYYGQTDAIIGPGVEFSNQLGFITYASDFGSDGLVITFNNNNATTLTLVEITFTFIDSAFVGDVLSTTPALNTLGLSYSLSGSTITLIYNLDGSMTLPPGVNTSTFSLTSPVAATPEPSSLALLGTGLAGIAGFARRRILRA